MYSLLKKCYLDSREKESEMSNHFVSSSEDGYSTSEESM